MSSSSADTRVRDWVGNSLNHASRQLREEESEPGALLKQKLMRLMKRVVSRDIGKGYIIINDLEVIKGETFLCSDFVR